MVLGEAQVALGLLGDHLDQVRVVLVGQPLRGEARHRVRLSHAVAHRVLRKHDARNHHHAVPVLGPHHTAVVDEVRVIRSDLSGEELALFPRLNARQNAYLLRRG